MFHERTKCGVVFLMQRVWADLHLIRAIVRDILFFAKDV